MVKVTQYYSYADYVGEVSNFLDTHDKEVTDVWEVLDAMQECWGIKIEITKEEESYFEGYMLRIINEHNETIEEMKNYPPPNSKWVDLDKKNPDFFTRGD